MFASREALVESLHLFDRPEGERLRAFLPAGADLDALVADLFLPLEEAAGR